MRPRRDSKSRLVPTAVDRRDREASAIAADFEGGTENDPLLRSTVRPRTSNRVKGSIKVFFGDTNIFASRKSPKITSAAATKSGMDAAKNTMSSIYAKHRIP
jgi:hypothetical protein